MYILIDFRSCLMVVSKATAPSGSVQRQSSPVK